MIPIAELRQRVKSRIDWVSKLAAERRTASHHRTFDQFLEQIAIPIFRMVAYCLTPEGHPFTVSTPAGRLQLRSRSGPIELELDASVDPPLVLGRSHTTRTATGSSPSGRPTRSGGDRRSSMPSGIASTCSTPTTSAWWSKAGRSSESLALAAGGGSTGIVVAVWSTPALAALAPVDLAGFERLTLDMRALAVAVGVSLLAALVLGAGSALALVRADPVRVAPGLDRDSSEHLP